MHITSVQAGSLPDLKYSGRLGIRADRVLPGSATLGHEYATAIAPSRPLAQIQGEISSIRKDTPLGFNAVPPIIYCDTPPNIRVIPLTRYPSTNIVSERPHHRRSAALSQASAATTAIGGRGFDWPDTVGSGQSRDLSPPGATPQLRQSSLPQTPAQSRAWQTHVSASLKMHLGSQASPLCTA